MVAHGSQEILHCAHLGAIINSEFHFFDWQIPFDGTDLKSILISSLDRFGDRAWGWAWVSKYQVGYAALGCEL
jgi:hypothetical protein